MLKNIFKILIIFIIGICGGIFADQIFWPYFIERPLFYQYRLEQSPIYLSQTKEIIIEENVALTEAIEKVKKVVVGIKAIKGKKISEGSGFFLTSDGLIVTLADFFSEGSKFNLFWNEKKLEGKILKKDFKNNLALIKIEGSNFPTAKFADFEKIKMGERVFLLGMIFEKGSIVNEGIIKTFDENFIETNIFEKENLKGSPLFNIKGEIIGLNIIDSEGKVKTLPISEIKKFSKL
jgi:S1-C subfamily serine protease